MSDVDVEAKAILSFIEEIDETCFHISDRPRMLDRISAALTAAERRGAAKERAVVVAWLRVTPRACGVLVDIASSQDIARLANAIEAGDHVRERNDP